MLSTEGFFRKSTFCTLMDVNSGFGGHWVMPWIFLLNGTFTMLEMEAFLLKTFFNSMHWCKSATLKIANLAKLNHYMVLLIPCTDFDFFLEVNAFIWSTMKVQFNENIYDMYQCPPNPGFTSIKVQNVDFLKKPSVDNIFFSSIMFS